MLATYAWASGWGTFVLRASPEGIVEISLPRPGIPVEASFSPVEAAEPDEVREVLRRAVNWLDAWLRGEQVAAEAFPAHPIGTPFMQALWQLIRTIPPGETRTYGALATQLGKPRGARSVGRGCARNPLPLWTPCHRVVGANGRLTGFSGGAGAESKRRLLAWERHTQVTPRPAPADLFSRKAAILDSERFVGTERGPLGA